MPIATVGGNDLFYTRSAGDGPAVVLIHGAGGNHLVWPPGLRRMADASVYALDLSGHGRSDGEGRDQITDYAADVIHFLRAIEENEVALIGHSMGGAIAQAMALIAPEQITRLVLLDTGAQLRVSDALLEKLAQDVEGAVRLIEKWAWGPEAPPALVVRGTEMMLTADPTVLLNDFVACNEFDLRDRASQIGKPTIVLTGSEDKMTPPVLGEWLSQQIPGGRFFEVPGAGHMAMLEKPDVVVDRIRSFLFRK